MIAISKSKEPWEKGIDRIENYDIKQRKVEYNADALLHSSGVGQAPPVYHTTLDKINVIAAKKAKIWNDIRNIIIPGTNQTLWQIAIKSKKLPVVRSGKEGHLDFYASNIREALKDYPDLNNN